MKKSKERHFTCCNKTQTAFIKLSNKRFTSVNLTTFVCADSPQSIEWIAQIKRIHKITFISMFLQAARTPALIR